MSLRGTRTRVTIVAEDPPCADDEQLAALLESGLGKSEAEVLRRHIFACEACCQRMLAAGASSTPERQGGGLLSLMDEPPAVNNGLSAWTPPTQFEHFRLLRRLGQGSMGQVFVGHDGLLDRAVAIKFIAAMSPDEGAQLRFMREARAIARLHHPNVVTVHSIGQVDGRPYLVTELVRGRSLAQLERPLSGARVLSIAIDLCRGLAAAHRRGVLHRDLKPANAIDSDEGTVKLLDFGLAKLVSRPRAHSSQPEFTDLIDTATAAEFPPILVAASVTQRGMLIGTPLYIAPEIWRGQPASVQTDLYSLGAVLYELSTGLPPAHAGTLSELRRKVLAGGIPACSSLASAIDARLAQAIDRCLARDPVARPRSAEDLLQDLLSIQPQHTRRPPDGNPFRGLHVFHAEHRAMFFGRESDLTEALERLRTQSLVVLLGDSGVGKSSLAYAAILPDVENGALGDGRTFQTISLAPGADPQMALATALSRAMACPAATLYKQIDEEPAALTRAIQERLANDAGLLIFIDQMEELVTTAQPEAAQRTAEFIAQLALGWPGLRVLASLRADFLTRIGALPALGRMLPASMQMILPLDRCALRMVMTEPLRQKGYAFESEAMIDEILDAVPGDGGLPLLQFSLSVLWDLRDSARLTLPVSALAQIGGLTGALAHHADLLLAALLPEQRAAARRVLCKLVSAEDTRRPRPESQLHSGVDAEKAALSALVQGRLVIAREASDGESCYELTHEALIRDWPTLRDWLTNEGERRAVRQRLEEAAAHWEALQRSSEALWGDAPLDELTHTGVDPHLLGEREQAFLTRSTQARRRRRRLRRAAFVLAPLLAVILAASAIVSVQSRDNAKRSEQSRQKEADLNTKMLARTPGNEHRLLRHALESAAPELGTGRPLSQNALGRLRSAVHVGRQSMPLVGHRQHPTWAAFSPDGTRVITTDASERAILWETATGRKIAELPHPNGTMAYRVFYSPNGRYIAQPMLNGTLRISDGQTGDLIADLRTGEIGGYHASFSPDSNHVAVAMGGTSRGSRDIPIWDLRTLKHAQTLRGHTSVVEYIAYSPNGQQLASVSAKNELIMHNMNNENSVIKTSLTMPTNKMITYSPDGKYLLGISSAGTPILWNTTTGQIHKVLQGHTSEVAWGVFSPSGQRVVTASQDATVRVWDTVSGQLLHTLSGHSRTVYAARVTPDDKRIISVGNEGEVRVWSLLNGTLLQRFSHHKENVRYLDVSSDGQHIVTTGDDVNPRLSNAKTGIWRNTVIYESEVDNLWLNENSVAVAASDKDNTILDSATRLPYVTIPERSIKHNLLGIRGAEMWLREGGILANYKITQENSASIQWQQLIGDDQAIYDDRSNLIILIHSANRISTKMTETGRTISAGGFSNINVCGTEQSPKIRRTVINEKKNMIALGFSDGSIQILTYPEFRVVFEKCVFSDNSQRGESLHSIQGLLFSDQYLISLCRNGDLALIDTEKLLVLKKISSNKESFGIHRHQASPFFAVSSHSPSISLYRISDLSVHRTFHGHSQGLLTMAFSSSGAMLASAGLDGTARVWDAETAEPISIFGNHTGPLNDVRFSFDDKAVFTASEDGTVRIWDPLTGQPVQAPEDGHLLRPVVSLSETEWNYMRESPPKSPQEANELIQMSCRLLRHQPEYPAVAAICAQFMVDSPTSH